MIERTAAKVNVHSLLTSMYIQFIIMYIEKQHELLASLDSITSSSPSNKEFDMPNVNDSPVSDKAIRPTEVAFLRSQPIPGSKLHGNTYAIEATDGRTVEVSLREWRAMLAEVSGLGSRRMIHRHLGLDLACDGVLLQVVR